MDAGLAAAATVAGYEVAGPSRRVEAIGDAFGAHGVWCAARQQQAVAPPLRVVVDVGARQGGFVSDVEAGRRPAGARDAQREAFHRRRACGQRPARLILPGSRKLEDNGLWRWCYGRQSWCDG